jgi:hypothetical protein
VLSIAGEQLQHDYLSLMANGKWQLERHGETMVGGVIRMKLDCLSV